MSTVQVSTTAALSAALAHVTSGEVIKLAPGTYSSVWIHDISQKAGVTIESSDPNHEAVFQDLTVSNCTNMTFEDLNFSVHSGPGKSGAQQFMFRSDTNLTLDKLTVGGAANVSNAASSEGVMVRQSTNVTLTNSSFSNLHDALDDLDNTNITISHNDFTKIYDDGIDNSGTSFVKITDNNFSTMHMDASDTQHPDCIQFWTAGETTSSHDITITGNSYTRGNGNPVQGIFIKDEVGHLPYSNVTIAQNTVMGALWNGIAVEGVANGVIEGNKVIGYSDQPSWIRTDTSGYITVANNAMSTGIMNINTSQLSAPGNTSASAMAKTADTMVASIDGLYTATLGHAPTAADIVSAESLLSNGTTFSALRMSLLQSSAGSAHTVASITSAYQDVLGRAPTSGEISAATSSIMSGDDSAALRQSLVVTAPGQAHTTQEITTAYQNLTGLAPTASDVSHWSAYIVAAGDQTASLSLQGAILADPTVQANVTSEINNLFQTYTGGKPTAAQVTSWDSQLASGANILNLQDTLERQAKGPGVQHVSNGAGASIVMGPTTSLLVVENFNPASSNIQAAHFSGINPLDAAHAHQVTASDGSTDVMITLDAQHSLLLEHTQLSSLHASDFIFH